MGNAWCVPGLVCEEAEGKAHSLHVDPVGPFMFWWCPHEDHGIVEWFELEGSFKII